MNCWKRKSHFPVQTYSKTSSAHLQQQQHEQHPNQQHHQQQEQTPITMDVVQMHSAGGGRGSTIGSLEQGRVTPLVALLSDLPALSRALGHLPGAQ